MEDHVVREVIKNTFEYSYLHDDWVSPLDEALAEITAEEALIRPGPAMKGIWEIVLHIAAWNENIVQRIRSGEPVRPEEGSWPPLPAFTDEEAWERAKKRLQLSIGSVRQTLEVTPIAQFEAAPYGISDLMCRFIHLAYHIGQITKIRECLYLHL